MSAVTDRVESGEIKSTEASCSEILRTSTLRFIKGTKATSACILPAVSIVSL